MEKKLKILVVDDEESIRFTFETFLSDAGYEVATAKDYEDAVAKIEGTNFDLIFADIILGGKSGLDFLREIRKRDLTCPVIMITGDPTAESASEAFRLEAFGHISKPLNQEKLLHLTKIALKV